MAGGDQDVVKGSGPGGRQEGRRRVIRGKKEGLWLPGLELGWPRQHYCTRTLVWGTVCRVGAVLDFLPATKMEAAKEGVIVR